MTLALAAPSEQATVSKPGRGGTTSANHAGKTAKRAMCRRHDGKQWIDLGALSQAQCLRRGFVGDTTRYVMFDANILSRHGDRIGLMTGGAWRPIRRITLFPSSTQDMKGASSLPLRAALPAVSPAILASSEAVVCRRFDGLAWLTIGTMTMRLCLEKGFSQPGTGHVQSGRYVMSRRAARIGVTQGSEWQPVAMIANEHPGRSRISFRTL